MPEVNFTANTNQPSSSVVNENTQNSSLFPETQGKHNQRQTTPILMTRNFMFSSPEGQANYNVVKSIFNFLITQLSSEQTNSYESSDAINKTTYLASISTYREIRSNKCSSLENRALNNALQLASGNEDFIELQQKQADVLTQGHDKSTAIRFIQPEINLHELTDQELTEVIVQEFDKVTFATSVLFQCTKNFDFIAKYKEEFTPENLTLYSKAIKILHMYYFCDSINENYTLNNAQKAKNRLVSFMTSLCMEYNNLLNQNSADDTLEVSQTDSDFFKMGIFAFCCELANLPIVDNDDGQTKYKIYTEVMKSLIQTGDSFPHVKPILRKIDKLISESSNVFSSFTTTPDLSALYKDIVGLSLKK